MKINIGSKNEVKINAVKETIQNYKFMIGAEIKIIDLGNSFSDSNPKSLKETIGGAMERAKKSFKECDYSFGIESGLMEVPFSKTGFMDVSACVIYDGKNFHIGLSSAFEFPKQITDLIFKENLNASQAFHKAKLTTEEYIGYSEGIISYLTKGKVNRKELTKPAIVNALIHLENPKLY